MPNFIDVAKFRTMARITARTAGTLIAATFAVFLAVEMSIRGGFAATVLPNGLDDGSPRSQAIVETFHLDSNLFVRYGYWLLDAVTGDFGRSVRGGTPVTEVIFHRLPISIEIMLAGMLLAIVIGVPMGLFSAARADRVSGRVLDGFFGLSQSIPVYLTAVFLVWLFAVRYGWLPAVGWVRISSSLTGNLRNLLMPAVALAFAEIGVIGRIVRTDVLKALQTDFIAAAVGKGMPHRYILFRHALRPASLGLLNVIGINVGSLLSGTVIIEIIFGIGGLGQVLFEASTNRDLYLLLGLTTYFVLVYSILNALVDGLMLAIDPRIRRTAA